MEKEIPFDFPPHINVESKSCPLGCPPDDQPVVSARDRINHLPGTWQVVQCRHCGLLRTNPRPDPESMAFFYPEYYSPYQDTIIQKRAIRESRLKKMVHILGNTTRLPNIPPGRLLEIGCASGAFLDKMAANGWQTEGLERSESASAQARAMGYTVHTGSLENAPDREARYDLIVGWMVLEHLHEPIRVLEKLHHWAKPSGYLVLSVPNVQSFEFKLFRDNWFALQLPNHLFHFTPDTLNKVLARGGWRLTKVMHQRLLSNLIASTGFKWQSSHLFPGIADRLVDFPRRPGRMHHLLFPLAFLLSLFGQTGRMTVWAIKD